MSPHMGQQAFRIAIFIILVSGCLLFIVKPGTAEFVITVATFVIGLVFAILIAVLARWGNRK